MFQLLGFAVLFFLLPALAWADPVAVPSPTDPDFFARVFAEIAAHNWRYVAALAVILGTWALRTQSDRLPFLQKGKWVWAVAVVGSALAALGTHLLSNSPVGGVVGILSVIASGAFTGFAAAGIFKGVTEFKNDK